MKQQGAVSKRKRLSGFYFCDVIIIRLIKWLWSLRFSDWWLFLTQSSMFSQIRDVFFCRVQICFLSSSSFPNKRSLQRAEERLWWRAESGRLMCEINRFKGSENLSVNSPEFPPRPCWAFKSLPALDPCHGVVSSSRSADGLCSAQMYF